MTRNLLSALLSSVLVVSWSGGTFGEEASGSFRAGFKPRQKAAPKPAPVKKKKAPQKAAPAIKVPENLDTWIKDVRNRADKLSGYLDKEQGFNLDIPAAAVVGAPGYSTICTADDKAKAASLLDAAQNGVSLSITVQFGQQIPKEGSVFQVTKPRKLGPGIVTSDESNPSIFRFDVPHPMEEPGTYVQLRLVLSGAYPSSSGGRYELAARDHKPSRIDSGEWIVYVNAKSGDPAAGCIAWKPFKPGTPLSFTEWTQKTSGSANLPAVKKPEARPTEPGNPPTEPPAEASVPAKPADVAQTPAAATTAPAAETPVKKKSGCAAGDPSWLILALALGLGLRRKSRVS